MNSEDFRSVGRERRSRIHAEGSPRQMPRESIQTKGFRRKVEVHFRSLRLSLDYSIILIIKLLLGHIYALYNFDISPKLPSPNAYAYNGKRISRPKIKEV